MRLNSVAMTLAGWRACPTTVDGNGFGSRTSWRCTMHERMGQELHGACGACSDMAFTPVRSTPRVAQAGPRPRNARQGFGAIGGRSHAVRLGCTAPRKCVGGEAAGRRCGPAPRAASPAAPQSMVVHGTAVPWTCMPATHATVGAPPVPANEKGQAVLSRLPLS